MNLSGYWVEISLSGYGNRCERLLRVLSAIERGYKAGSNNGKPIISELQKRITKTGGHNGKRGSISNCVSRLIRDGYVRKTVDERDKRRILLSIDYKKILREMIKESPDLLWKWLSRVNHYTTLVIGDEMTYLFPIMREGNFKCKECNHLSTFTFTSTDETFGEGILATEFIRYECSNCGFEWEITGYP